MPENYKIEKPVGLSIRSKLFLIIILEMIILTAALFLTYYFTQTVPGNNYTEYPLLTGESSFYIFLLIVIVIQAIFILIMWLAMDRLVSSRLAALSLNVAKISKLKQVQGRVPVQGNDELSLLANYVNEMLEKIESSQESLYQKQQAEERLRMTIESVARGIITSDLTGNILDLNESAASMLDYQKEELICRNIRDLITVAEWKKLDGIMNTAIEQDDQVDVELLFVGKNDKGIPVEFTIAVLKGPVGNNIGLVSCFRDISDRKRTEGALIESEDKFRRIYEESPIGIAICDIVGRLLSANKTCLDILGVHGIEDIKAGFFELNPVNNEMKNRLLYGEIVRFEVPLNFDLARKNMLIDSHRIGTIHISIIASPLSAGRGQPAGRFVVLVQDITRRKTIDELKDEFIGLVSHELRTPLTIILGSLKILQTERSRLSPEETDRLIQDTVYESETMTLMITNLLELSRSQAERMDLNVEPVSIPALIGETVDAVQQKSRGREIIKDFISGLPVVYADPVKLQLVMNNLLDNAVKYSPDGGPVRVTARKEQSDLVISVSDTGIGISESDQERLFRPFEKVGDQEFIKGSGIGLLVCRRLLEMHGGKIWVESRLGKGSTFSFSIPVSGSGQR